MFLTVANTAQVGLTVAALLQLMNTFQFGMRQSAEMENFMTSVERTLEYTKLEPENNNQTGFPGLLPIS